MDDAAQEALRAQALEEAESERQANILEAKSMIKLIMKSFKRACSSVSVIWTKWFFIPEMIDPNLEGI
jgi:hypothetical protein